MNKQNIAIIYGGRSTEHEISIRSAKNIAEALDKDLFHLILIGVDKTGVWNLKTEEQLKVESTVQRSDSEVLLFPGGEDKTFLLKSTLEPIPIDVIFPIIHGTGGEDGALQGILKSLNKPFVGPSVIGSSLCIDKDIAKKLLRDAGIASSRFLSYHYDQKDQIKFEHALKELGLPMYVKPPNLGSSVGISKVNSKREFFTAIELALKFDKKVLIEENIVGREIECAVLGNENPQASLVGEVVTIGESHDFYSYDAKYTDAHGSITVIPADISDTDQENIRKIAINTYKVLECEGMARVDVFLTDEGNILVNEVNTLPGFTDISMYPKLWESTGIPYEELISKLIQLAKSRFEMENGLIVDMDAN